MREGGITVVAAAATPAALLLDIIICERAENPPTADALEGAVAECWY